MSHTNQRTRIAIVDYLVTKTNPLGQCNRKIVEGLCNEYDFVVFSKEFDNPCPNRVKWVRIPAPTRPLALLFIVFHVLAPLYFFAYLIRHRAKFDVVQYSESNFLFGSVSYSQFCHRAYLNKHNSENSIAGLRPLMLWLDHWLHSMLEPLSYRRAKAIVAPSSGLKQELLEEYPFLVPSKIAEISNPVSVEGLKLPSTFDREETRRELGLTPDDIALVFVALGHFERKGLPPLLEALANLGRPMVKLIVVGGNPDLISEYTLRSQSLGLGSNVCFVGMTDDVRPYLWASDAFVLPSAYETFSLVTFEAAAAGLPLVVSRLHGVEDLVRDGENSILIKRDLTGIVEGLERLFSLTALERQRMGQEARKDIEKYDSKHFVAAWRRFYIERTTELRR